MKIHGHRKGTDTCSGRGSEDVKGQVWFRDPGDDKRNGF